MILKEQIIEYTFLSNCVNNVKLCVEADKLIFYCETASALTKTLKKLHLIFNHFEKDLEEVLDQTGLYLTVCSNLTEKVITVKECSE